MKFLFQIINGLHIGSIYALVALGYSMVYGIVKLINFAHGDIIMVGAYAAYVLLVLCGLPVWVAVIGSIVFCALAGVLIERIAYRRLLVKEAPRISLLITAIGVSYFLVRILGKYAGAWLGCRLVKKDKLVRNYLGLALIPQAGVAIGLAALGARTLGGTMGSDLQTIILASSVLYELIGPGCAKLALYLSRSYSTRLEDVAAVEEVTETGERKSDVQLLIERIQKIQSELPALDNDISEEEAAFTEAAEEQLAQTQAQRRFFYLRR